MTGSILDTMKQRIVLLDGGMGTMLIAHGFPQGACPELWNVERPEVIRAIHTAYFKSGADVVLTNSFGGSRIKLESYGLGGRCYELNRAAAELAAEVRPPGRFTAGSLGPTGKFLQPVGEYEAADFEAAFEEQARGLHDGGVDFLLIETQYDLNEALCALRAARRVTDKPVFVTMTFNKGPRGFHTMMGNSPSGCIQSLESQGVPALGANCSLDSEEMAELVGVLREQTSLPLIIQANAGRPAVSDDGTVSYDQGLEDYVRFVPRIIANGANLIGGCCGTDPSYILRMAEIIRNPEARGDQA